MVQLSWRFLGITTSLPVIGSSQCLSPPPTEAAAFAPGVAPPAHVSLARVYELTLLPLLHGLALVLVDLPHEPEKGLARYPRPL